MRQEAAAHAVILTTGRGMMQSLLLDSACATDMLFKRFYWRVAKQCAITLQDAWLSCDACSLTKVG